MRKILLLFVVLFTASCAENSYPDLSDILDQFADPAKEYRPAPLWVWNTDMQKSDIDHMLTSYKEQGFGGAFVHPRPGLETEYLSQEWFDLWQYSVQKGEELGLDIWIYDENSYPSGFAGGNVPAQMPESYNQGNALVGRRSEYPPAVDSCYLCLSRMGDSFADITSSLSSYQGRKGNYYIYEKHLPSATAWTAGYPYVDLLVDGVTEKFIDVTMTGYEKTFGQDFASKVHGSFTDEPNIYPGISGHCRWTPDLFDTFQKMWGYDLRTSWPLLAEEIGNWKKVRHDYNATLLRLFIDRWAKPWHEYTQNHSLVWTGHYWEHSWPDLSNGPDNMAMYAWHQMPAIDMLFNQYDDKSCNAQFGNVRSVKELRSVANQMGYRRTLSETYGGAGADLSFADMKRLGDWEYALGVNFMNQHLSHTTVTGVRKYDYPPEFTPISPWWSEYHVLNDYFARLSLLLSNGEQLCDWLVLEPTTSLWLYFSGAHDCSKKLYAIGDAFQNLVTRLEKNMVEFDLGCEDIIRDCGSVTSKGLTIGERTYTTVVIPPLTENLECGTYLLLEEFVAKGGRLIMMSKPSLIDGTPFSWKLNGTPISTVDQLLDLYNTPLNYTSFDGLYHQHRTYGDGELYFFVNPSMSENHTLAFSSKEEKYIYSLDAMTGAVTRLADNSVSTVLPPAGSALYFVTDSDLPSSVHVKYTKTDTLSLGELKVERVNPNVLNLDFCTLTLDREQHNNLYVKEANRLMWSEFGRNDPWESAVQYRRSILESDTITYGNIMAEYRFNISEGVDLSSMRVIVERPDIWNIAMNGRPLVASEDTLLDSRCGIYDVSSSVRKGSNCVTIQRDIMSIHAELAPVMVIGDFDVLPVSRGWRLAPVDHKTLGNLVHTGCPEYPWDISYSRILNLNSVDGRYVLKLGQWHGTMAKVIVNGKNAGNISFPPYELDITGMLTSGENTLDVRVCGSLRNMYGPHFANEKGIAGPWSWNGVGKQLSGSEYQLSPLGLEEDYKIINEK